MSYNLKDLYPIINIKGFSAPVWSRKWFFIVPPDVFYYYLVQRQLGKGPLCNSRFMLALSISTQVETHRTVTQSFGTKFVLYIHLSMYVLSGVSGTRSNSLLLFNSLVPTSESWYHSKGKLGFALWTTQFRVIHSFLPASTRSVRQGLQFALLLLLLLAWSL
jgi:hypothetical protein